MITRTICLAPLLLLISCGTPKPTIPSLNPEEAASLLHYNNKAQAWLTYVQKNNAGCAYRLDLPDQVSHPTTLDLDHVVYCGSKPSPKEFDASVSFAYNANQQKWVITRFSS